LKSTETLDKGDSSPGAEYFSNFGSLKSTETRRASTSRDSGSGFQQFRLVEEH